MRSGGGGNVQVGRERLRRKLGVCAYYTWAVLLSLRDAKNLVFVPLASILARCRSLHSPQNIQYGLRRLALAGLVENLGRRTLSVGKYRPKRFVRRVLGASYRDLCIVPPETAMWLETASEWGGKHSGSGPKKRSEGYSSFALKHVRSTCESEIAIETGLPTEDLCPPAACILPSCEQDLTSLGSTFSPRSPASSALTLGVEGFPYPSASILPPAYVPSPPLIGHLSAESKVGYLVRTYREAVRTAYKKLAFVSAPTKSVFDDLSGSKVRVPNYGTPWSVPLLQAADALVEHEIPPAAWAAFSIDAWREYAPDGQGEKPPRLKWVWSAKRIKERFEWFLSEENAYMGRRAVFGKKHRALLDRYDEMMAEIARSRTNAREIASRYFPGETYQRMFDAALTEARETQKCLDDAAREDVWL